MGCGTRLCSDFFEVCGQLFRLEVYPGGFTADACRYVSVFLTTPGSLNPNHIMYELAILDQVGLTCHKVTSPCPPPRFCLALFTCLSSHTIIVHFIPLHCPDDTGMDWFFFYIYAEWQGEAHY